MRYPRQIKGMNYETTYTLLTLANNIMPTDQRHTFKRPSLPGTVGTPAFFIVSRAVALSPITRMLSGCTMQQEFHSFPHKMYRR